MSLVPETKVLAVASHVCATIPVVTVEQLCFDQLIPDLSRSLMGWLRPMDADDADDDGMVRARHLLIRILWWAHRFVGNTMATFVMQSLGCDVSAINTVHFSKRNKRHPS